MTRQKRNSEVIGAAVLKMAGLCVCLGLTGCGGMSMPSTSSFTSLFDEKEDVLPGRRVAVLEYGKDTATGAETVPTPMLPPAQANASWPSPGGNPSNSPGHLMVAEKFQQTWSASVGTGSSKAGRMTAVPVAADGKIFTLDIEGNITAVSESSGSTVWHINVRPEKQSEKGGYGGGLAYEGGRLFAVTGYGTAVAVEAATGKVLWAKEMGVPFRMAPTAANGRLFAVNTDSELRVLNTSDGAELWTARGLPETAVMISNASPAVSGNVVIVPYPSGEVTALDVNTGRPRWSENIARSSPAGARFSAISMPARPVADGNAVFAASRAGSIVATSKDTGERLWQREIKVAYTPCVAGDTVFVVDEADHLFALSRKDGKIRWTANLPHSRWVGPVLASGKLYVISDKGGLVSADAATGAVTKIADLGVPVSIAPIVANGKMFVLSDKARLYAMN